MSLSMECLWRCLAELQRRCIEGLQLIDLGVTGWPPRNRTPNLPSKAEGWNSMLCQAWKEWQRNVTDVREAYETEAINRSVLSSGGNTLTLSDPVSDLVQHTIFLFRSDVRRRPTRYFCYICSPAPLSEPVRHFSWRSSDFSQQIAQVVLFLFVGRPRVLKL
jgi:hypothetical protein